MYTFKNPQNQTTLKSLVYHILYYSQIRKEFVLRIDWIRHLILSISSDRALIYCSVSSHIYFLCHIFSHYQTVMWLSIDKSCRAGALYNWPKIVWQMLDEVSPQFSFTLLVQICMSTWLSWEWTHHKIVFSSSCCWCLLLVGERDRAESER